MKRPILLTALSISILCPSLAHSFCGFYVASGNAKLFNHASQVILVRDGDRTVITMANDYQGDPKEFAIVVPVPTVLEKGQVHVGDKAIVDHVEAFSAPRLVEYFDPDPCPVANMDALEVQGVRKESAALGSTLRAISVGAAGVRVEAQFTVDEYDIVILSATQSNGLVTWLTENHYRIPDGAERVLGTYIKQNMKFFVAKVNLKEQKKLGFTYLRPLQVAYESPKFMLPIRLGMVNADGPQELFVYAIMRDGRVETTNYRTVKLPSDQELPDFVKPEFADFYRAMFAEQVRQTNMSVIFTEYAWDMGGCDPCASSPLSPQELAQLGVFWIEPESAARGWLPQNVAFITRLHVRYDAAHFPEDLVLQGTGDRTLFQGRYILRHEWKGTTDCDAAKAYRAKLPERRRTQAENLSQLTGWSMDRIRGKMTLAADWSAPEDHIRWWQRLWTK